MPGASHMRDRVTLVAACVLAVSLALALAALAASARPASSNLAVVLAEDPVVSTLATPCAPVSVTRGRSFTVTAAVASQPGDAASATIECRHLLADGTWVAEESVPAALHTTGTASPYVSAAVSLAATGTWVLRAIAGTETPSVSATSTEIRVSAMADHIVWNRDGQLTLPERMADRNDALQLIVATANSLASHAGTVTVYEYRSGDWLELFASPSRFGSRALRDGMKRHRDDHTTPTGIWQMPDFVFGMHAAPPSGTKMPFRHITGKTWWSAEKGAHFNTWVSHRVDGERLADAPVQYEYALSTGFNAKPNTSVVERGTAIFLHVWKGAGTAGCVAVPRSMMLRVFRTLDPSVRRVFAVGTTAETGATSIYAY